MRSGYRVVDGPRRRGADVTDNGPPVDVAHLDACPSCGVSWVGAEIAPEHRHMYGGVSHGSRQIGVYSRELDRTVEWLCPDCGTRWPR